MQVSNLPPIKVTLGAAQAQKLIAEADQAMSFCKGYDNGAMDQDPSDGVFLMKVASKPTQSLSLGADGKAVMTTASSDTYSKLTFTGDTTQGKIQKDTYGDAALYNTTKETTFDKGIVKIHQVEIHSLYDNVEVHDWIILDRNNPGRSKETRTFAEHTAKA